MGRRIPPFFPVAACHLFKIGTDQHLKLPFSEIKGLTRDVGGGVISLPGLYLMKATSSKK